MSSLGRFCVIFTRNISIKPETTSLLSSSKSAFLTSRNNLRRQRRLQDMVELFKKESSASYQFRDNARVYDNVVNRLISAKQFSMIEDVLESQKKYVTSEGFVVRLIMLYGKAGMFNHARKAFDEMPQFKCERTVMSFNALLSSCVNAKGLDKVEGLFRELPSQLSLEVNLISYNIVIHALCQMGSIDSALSMVDELKKSGLEPDLVTYNTLLEALFKNDQYHEGEMLWATMDRKNMAPDIISYNSKIRGVVRYNGTSEAVKLIDEMKKKKVLPDKITFHELIKGFCSEGKPDEAKHWYNQLRKRKCIPGNSIYLTLLPFLCEVGDADTAVEICSKAINDQSLTNVGVLTSVVNALIEQRKFDEAIELVELGKSKKFKIELPLAFN